MKNNRKKNQHNPIITLLNSKVRKQNKNLVKKNPFKFCYFFLVCSNYHYQV